MREYTRIDNTVSAGLLRWVMLAVTTTVLCLIAAASARAGELHVDHYQGNTVIIEIEHGPGEDGPFGIIGIDLTLTAAPGEQITTVTAYQGAIDCNSSWQCSLYSAIGFEDGSLFGVRVRSGIAEPFDIDATANEGQFPLTFTGWGTLSAAQQAIISRSYGYPWVQARVTPAEYGVQSFAWPYFGTLGVFDDKDDCKKEIDLICEDANGSAAKPGTIQLTSDANGCRICSGDCTLGGSALIFENCADEGSDQPQTIIDECDPLGTGLWRMVNGRCIIVEWPEPIGQAHPVGP